uniref:Ig-like domain-containing protein n=1 Tax=Macrostomum lignano TaxID=282301 RepID=A0A1I8FS15_9PLAT
MQQRYRCFAVLLAFLFAGLLGAEESVAVAVAATRSLVNLSQRIVPHSPAVAFYTTEGRRLFGYYDNPKPDSAAFVCSFRSGRSRWRGARSVSYSVAVLQPSNASSPLVSIRGRVVRLLPAAGTEAQIVLACSVNYTNAARNLSITEWNVLIIDPRAKLMSNEAWLDLNYSPSQALNASLELNSASDAPLKSQANTVSCQAQLTLFRNGDAVLSLPTDFEFDWSADGSSLTVRQNLAYQPDANNATDSFECRADDPLTLETATQRLKVAYKAGLRRGRVVTNDSNIDNSDTLSCQADVGMPEVTYSWRIIQTSQLVATKGQNLSLTHVNLYYPICCKGMNVLNGQKYSSEVCVSFRGNSTLHTVVMFDTDGRRESPLVCGERSTMGILQVRYSKLKCSVKLENLTRGRSSSAVAAMVAEDAECSIYNCTSHTALARVSAQKKAASWTHLADGPVPPDCDSIPGHHPRRVFLFSGGMMRIEVDYFCTAPRYVRFDATGQGATGSIIRYFVPKTGCFEISAAGAAGGNHSTSYGNSGGGTWLGGRGASARGKFRLERGQMLAIVVGQHGGNSSEVSPSRRPSIEDNAGTGGGGGSFVYNRARWSSTWPLAAAAAPATPLPASPDRPARTAPTRPDRISARLAGAASTVAPAGPTRRPPATTAAAAPAGSAAGGGGGSFCNATMSLSNSCSSVTGGNEASIDGSVTIYYLDNQC